MNSTLSKIPYISQYTNVKIINRVVEVFQQWFGETNGRTSDECLKKLYVVLEYNNP